MMIDVCSVALNHDMTAKAMCYECDERKQYMNRQVAVGR